MILQKIDLYIYIYIYMFDSTYFSKIEKCLLWNVVVETGQLEKIVGHQL